MKKVTELLQRNSEDLEFVFRRVTSFLFPYKVYYNLTNNNSYNLVRKSAKFVLQEHRAKAHKETMDYKMLSNLMKTHSCSEL